MSWSKQCKVTQLVIHSLASNIVVLLVEFHSDEVPFLLDGCYCSSSATNAVVKHKVALIRVCPYKVSDKSDWLLGGMEKMPILMLLRDSEYARWKFHIRNGSWRFLIVAITAVRAFMLTFPLTMISFIRLTSYHLRIICWQMLVEDTDVLMLTQWHTP